MTTYNTTAKNSTTYTAGTNPAFTTTSTPIGLLLVLTASTTTGTEYTTTAKNSTSYSTVNKN